MLREEKQDVMINVANSSKKAAINLFFISGIFASITEWEHQLFYKYNVDFCQVLLKCGFVQAAKILYNKQVIISLLDTHYPLNSFYNETIN